MCTAYERPYRIDVPTRSFVRWQHGHALPRLCFFDVVRLKTMAHPSAPSARAFATFSRASGHVASARRGDSVAAAHGERELDPDASAPRAIRSVGCRPRGA